MAQRLRTNNTLITRTHRNGTAVLTGTLISPVSGHISVGYQATRIPKYSTLSGEGVDRATINFIDIDSGSKGFILARRVPNGVGITLSLIDDGDMEVFLDFATVRRLMNELRLVIPDAQ